MSHEKNRGTYSSTLLANSAKGFLSSFGRKSNIGQINDPNPAPSNKDVTDISSDNLNIHLKNTKQAPSPSRHPKNTTAR